MIIFTTLFRLSLNVSSTRLIIGSGFAGSIIKRFSEFVTGGSLGVGIILFVIIVIVQFVVITKGAERVAEVAARFTLDAMPGKQMAIDADLNSGMINEEQARERRQKIQDEASFYGAMDGATKFVKGDAIVGIMITFINIVGGIVVGVTANSMSISDAMSTYTKLTIGDGLVSQIPAFIISVATAILVTKGGQSADMAEDFRKQLLSSPFVLYIAAGVLAFLGVFAGMYILIPGAIAAYFAGNSIKNFMEIKAVEDEIEAEETEEEEVNSASPENVRSMLKVDPIELAFGYGILPLADASQGGDLLERVKLIRRQVANELGAVVPIIRLRDEIQLNPNEYVIRIKGVEVSSGSIMFDHYLAMNPGHINSSIEGIETIEPAFNLPAYWITEEKREEADAKGYTVVDSTSIIATHLTETVKRHIHELLNRQEVQELVDQVKESSPALISELIPNIVNVGEIQKVLANLLKEGVSIKDLVTIFETIADYGAITKDPEILTEYVRQNMARYISKLYFEKTDNLVITLDPEIEQIISEGVKSTETGVYSSIDPNITQKIFEEINEQMAKVINMGKTPIIVTAPIVRIYLKRLTEKAFKDLVILSFNEIEDVEVESVGMVSLQ